MHLGHKRGTSVGTTLWKYDKHANTRIRVMTERGSMHCDIILVSWNEPEITRLALHSIHCHSHHPHRLIVVDNASDTETVSMLRQAEKSRCFGELTVIYNRENLGWIKALNQGLAVTQAPYVCVINNDVIVGSHWLYHMIRTMEAHSEIGLANPQERKRIGGNRLEEINRCAKRLARRYAGRFIEIDYGSGFCLLIRRAVLQAIGGFDERYGMGYYEDEDFSRRAIEAGYIVVRCLDALVVHHTSHSFGKDPERKRKVSEHNRALYEARWGRHRHVLVWARYPGAAADILRMARQRHVLYVVENRYVNRRSLPHPHANIKFRGRWIAWFAAPLYFRLKAWQLCRQGRIEQALVLDGTPSVLPLGSGEGQRGSTDR